MTVGLSDSEYVPDPESFAIFFLLKCGTSDQWFRAWSGHGLFRVAADGFDTAGGTYTGFGFPANLPALSGVINGQFNTIEFTLAGPGVDLGLQQVANIDRHLVNGAKVHVGLMDLAPLTLAPASDLDWLLTATAGMPSLKKVSKTDEDGRAQLARSISLPCVAGFKDRRLAPVAYWTGVGQRARSADDAFCDLTSIYASNSTVKWPG